MVPLTTEESKSFIESLSCSTPHEAPYGPQRGLSGFTVVGFPKVSLNLFLTSVLFDKDNSPVSLKIIICPDAKGEGLVRESTVKEEGSIYFWCSQLFHLPKRYQICFSL